jgi:hypothetical protein
LTSARFGPERQIVYVASWEGQPFGMHLVNTGARESRSLSEAGGRIVAANDTEVAFLRGGILARAPLAGGPPREVSQSVVAADWTADASEFAIVHYHEHRFRLEYPIGTPLGWAEGSVSRLRLSPDGSLIAPANGPASAATRHHRVLPGGLRGRVVVVNGQGERIAVSGDWGSMDGVAWSPSGDEVWFTATRVGAECELHAMALDGSVRTVHAAMGRLVLHDIAPDGRVLLERTGLRSETWFHRVGAPEDRELTWLDVTGTEGLSADGTQVLLVESGEGGGPDYMSYLRPTDGSLPVRIGPGRATSLSLDGKWALMIPVRQPDHVEIVPTGPGRSRRVEIPDAARYDMAGWLPDGKSFYVTTRDADGARATWLVDAGGGEPRRLPLPAGVAVYYNTFSPEGQRFVARCPESEGHCVYPTAGGEPEALARAEPEWSPVAWDRNGQVYFRERKGRIPEVLWRVDVETGQPERVAEISPRNRSGVLGLSRLSVAQSGDAWAYSLMRRLSDLYVVTDLS